MPSIGNHITVLKSTDSSNNYAMQQVHAGMAEHGQVWFALEQTAGKGQRGKEWKGTAAENILMSVVLETGKLTIGQQFRLSAAVAVAVRNFFAFHAGENTCIKWPNDLYWCDRKAGGILIENVIGGSGAGNWKWAVVGIGININQMAFAENLPNPISLYHITQKKYEMMELVNELCECLEKQWQILITGKWDKIYNEYNTHLYKVGKQVRLRKKNVVMPCTIRGVSKKGKLLIEEDETVRFGFGEVSWEIGD
jgi:BirA family transcriptional regulator, biotin operon repressor / biotin---[acetyl-CoA-carboxylase] ligase